MDKELLPDSRIENNISQTAWERFVGPVIKHWARTAGSGLLFLSTILSPIDSPKPVRAESNQSQASPDLLHGDRAFNKHTKLYLPYNGTTRQMLLEVKEDTFLITPTNEFKDKVNIYTTNPQEDLKCDQNGICDLGAIDREINRFISTYGIIPHETLVVIKADGQYGNGRALLPSRSSSPDIYSSSTVVRPVTAWRDEGVRRLFSKAIAHELWGHAFAGFDHEGEDLMDGNCSGYACSRFNDPHTQFLRAHFALSPYNYLIPKNEVKATAGSLNLKAELVTPSGTTQQKRWIIPANNDGPDITLLRNPEGSFEVPAPEIGVGNYILLPGMSYTWKEWSSNHPVSLAWDSSKWDSLEGWPGIFFPNPPAEFSIRTPKRDSSGIIAVSPKNNELVVARRVFLQWDNKDKDVFYYEVQASPDCTFNTDPQTATAPVWHNLIHGGMTSPLNSWQTPELELGSKYCWRARPRIQGDGTPVDWSETFRFSTPSALKSVSGAGPSAEDLARWGRDNDDIYNDNTITITLVQEVEGPGGIKEVVSYPHIIPLDNQAYRRKEESLPLAA